MIIIAILLIIIPISVTSIYHHDLRHNYQPIVLNEIIFIATIIKNGNVIVSKASL